MLNEKECKNTLEFKNFKLHTNNTLKSMSKEELINYIHMLHHNWSVSDEQLFNVIEKNNTLQNEVDYYKHEYYSLCDLYENPQPYIFEELHEDMWFWHDSYKRCYQIYYIEKDRNLIYLNHDNEYINFEENLFFPVTKAMEYQEGRCK